MRFVPELSARIQEVAIDRAKSPSLGPDHAFVAPEVHSTTLPNGLILFVVENHELPKVAVRLYIRAGTCCEEIRKAGVALLTTRTIDKGAKGRSALEIEKALATLGTEIAAFATVEAAEIHMQVLKRNLEPALAIFSDVVLHPRFADKEVDRELKKLGDELILVRQDPNRIARRAGQMLGMGADHPYGHSGLGTEDSLRSLTRSDVEDYYKRLYTPSNAALVLVGDITPDEAQTLAKKYLGAWSGPAVAAFTAPPPKPARPGRIYLVDRQDAAQSVVSLLLPGIARGSPDFHAFQIVDAVWGGTFGSRVNLNLRENKGYSYGVFSSPTFLRSAGSWQASGGVQTKVTKESAAELIAELKAISGTKPIDDKELAGAKANRVRGYSQGFEGLDHVAGRVGGLWVLDRPMSELASEPVELEKVTAQQANTVARRYADPSKAALLVVGDGSKIEDGLAKLGFGEIVRLDALGRPLEPGRDR